MTRTMTRNLIAGVALMAGLAFPVAGLAHEGHAHKVIGTVASVNGSNLMVKTTDGKTVMVMLDARTTVLQGKTKLEPGALKVGDRIVAEGPEEKEMVTATSVRLGAPVAAAKPAAKK
jgi:hypothetical protein